MVPLKQLQMNNAIFLMYGVILMSILPQQGQAKTEIWRSTTPQTLGPAVWITHLVPGLRPKITTKIGINALVRLKSILKKNLLRKGKNK